MKLKVEFDQAPQVNLDELPWRACASSNIKAVAQVQDLLFVEFTNGGVYCYFEIPHQRTTAMRHSKSIGSYFARQIKGKYPCARIAS